MRQLARTLALGAPLLLAFASTGAAQVPASNDHDRVDQQLNGQRAALKAAIRSGDPKRRAAERARLRSAYGADWRDDHPRQSSPSATASADQRLAAEKERYEAVYKSGNKAAIANEKAKLSAAYAAANLAHKRR